MKENDATSSSDESSAELDEATPATARPRSYANSRRHWLKNTLAAGAGLAAFNLPATSDAQTTTNAPPPPSPAKAGAPKPTAGTPGTSYISFSGLDFRPASSATTFDWTGGNYCGIYALNGGWFTAKLYVPEQSKITEVEFYINHNVSGTNVFYLFETSALGGYGGYIAMANLSAPVNSTIQTVNLTSFSLPWLVDNSTTGVYLAWFPGSAGSEEILYGARVGYTGGIGRFKANNGN